MTSFSKLGVRARSNDLFLALHELPLVSKQPAAGSLERMTHKSRVQHDSGVQSHSVVSGDSGDDALCGLCLGCLLV